MIMTDIPAAAISVAGSNPGATSHIIYLLIAFLFGGAVSYIVWGWVYLQHKKAWRLEYRRLMRGIFAARHAVVDNNMSRLMVSRHLKQLYDGEK